jgi:hypothetical protein
VEGYCARGEGRGATLGKICGRDALLRVQRYVNDTLLCVQRDVNDTLLRVQRYVNDTLLHVQCCASTANNRDSFF